jgi:ABC-type dipeptide/oligopeptide/nickel transport system permease component
LSSKRTTHSLTEGAWKSKLKRTTIHILWTLAGLAAGLVIHYVLGTIAFMIMHLQRSGSQDFSLKTAGIVFVITLPIFILAGGTLFHILCRKGRLPGTA